MQTACPDCACIDAVPENYRHAEPADPCVCGHPLDAHTGACPKCGADVHGMDVACRRCGALVGDEIERAALEPRNGYAYASVLFGIFFLAGIGSVLAIIFGVIARRQIARNPQQRGADMAFAGILLGSAWLIVIGGLLLYEAIF